MRPSKPIQNDSGLPEGPSRSLRARLRVRETGRTGWGEPMPALRRREFISLVGGAAAAWPLAARAQDPGRVYRLGALIPAGRETPAVVAFFDEMRLHGFIEGRNLDVIPGGFNVPRDRID